MLNSTEKYIYLYFSKCVVESEEGKINIRIGKSRLYIVRGEYVELSWEELQTLLGHRPEDR